VVRPPQDLLNKILSVAEVRPTTAKPERKRTMTRLAYVAILLVAVAVGSVLVMPNRSTKANIQSLLVGVAQAMEEATSMRLAGQGSSLDPKSPIGLKLQEGEIDLWVTSRKFCLLSRNNQVIDGATCMDAAAGEWWAFEAAGKRLFLADLKPLGERAEEIIAKIGREFLNNQIIDTLVEEHPEAKKSVEIVERDGKEIAVISTSHTAKTSPVKVTKRNIFEVDTATNRMLSVHQYAQAEGGPEELIARLDSIEYNTPVPSGRAELGIPEDVEIVQATAEIRESDELVSIVLLVNGENIAHFDITRE
jgi:hypothetical protein